MDHLIREAQKRVGTVLRERWTIDGLIGVGGMAAVYKATHRNGNEVAIKILHSDISDSEQIRKRFQREGYVANRVKHKSAVPVFDDDTTEDGCAFLVMELLRGENVEERRERLGGFVPLSEVLGIADQVLDALAAAHGQGIIHRDVKPENLFLTEEGVVKVLDFGIARLQSAGVGSNLTVAGAMIGTPGFMSPEQAGGFTDRIDAQTDVWGMGATIFTLLCGQHVHQAASANENVIRSATKPARSIAAVLPDLDPGVVALVDKALAFHKRDRWPDAKSMQRELRTVANRVLGRARAGSSVALELELSEPLSTSGVLLDPEGPTRIRKLALDPLRERPPASAVPVSEEPATHRQPTLPPGAGPEPSRPSQVPPLEPSRPSQVPQEPRARVSTGRPVAAPSALPVPRAIAIAVAGTILVLAVLFAVAVGTIMRQRMSAAPEPSGSLATPPVVDLAPDLGPLASSSPALDAEPDAAAEIDAGLVTDAATPSDASSPDADADAAPKPPLRKRWYRKKRRTSSTAK